MAVAGVEADGDADGEGVWPMTNSGFFILDCRGEGVEGLLGLGRLGLGLSLGDCPLERVEAGSGEGEGEDAFEKKEVIWRCGLTSGDLPLLGLRAGAISVVREEGSSQEGSEV